MSSNPNKEEEGTFTRPFTDIMPVNYTKIDSSLLLLLDNAIGDVVSGTSHDALVSEPAR